MAYRVPVEKKYLYSGVCIAFLILSVYIAYRVHADATERYEKLLSVVIADRHNIPISVSTNVKGHYALPITHLPDTFTELLLKKEDRFFAYHLGINPVSMIRALYHYLSSGSGGGSSTLTEQLAKNILGNENDRTITHKLRELVYAASMELFFTKDTILTMYANTVYLGNQVQGFETASRAYFGKTLADTTAYEQIVLLTTLSYPASRNPWKDDNEPYAHALYARLIGGSAYVHPVIHDTFSFQDPLSFELMSMGITCAHSCVTTLDAELTAHVREIVRRTTEKEYARGVRNGAVVIIDPRTEELLAIVGSPDSHSDQDGGKINMAIAPRPIGSTVKPFIYLKGFMMGLRPYSRVDDREYRYPIATGFALYPKNFDGAYHGEVTLHTALSNSLNVPSVKILEYIGLPTFYTFLQNTLAFTPIQPLDSYQYGIALGGLEMDLLTLTHYFTLFPREGTLAPLTISPMTPDAYTPPQSAITRLTTVADPAYTELVTAILSDRLTGVEQFGLKSSLNLSRTVYAVKTGTSRDFHDSWVIGYTPDFVVGVWLGNSENEPLAQVSGQSGAGVVWHDTMEHLFTTPYATDRPFKNNHITSFDIAHSREWGLPDDVLTEHEGLLIADRLITSPHEGDIFEYTETTHIPLQATKPVTWRINGTTLGFGDSVNFTPTAPGTYEVEAVRENSDAREILTIHLTSPQ